MAITTSTPTRDEWTAKLADYRAAMNALNSLDHKTNPAGLDVLFQRCANAEDELFAVRSPDLDACADKLIVLLHDDVAWAETDEGAKFRDIIGELRQFACQAHGLDTRDEDPDITP